MCRDSGLYAHDLEGIAPCYCMTQCTYITGKGRSTCACGVAIGSNYGGYRQ